jgi:hypothetical protein
MPPEVGLIALMHVSAVVGVLAAAYVGIDRSRGGRLPNDGAYEEAHRIANELVLKLGLNNENGHVMKSRKWGYVRIIYPAGVICVVARRHLRLGWLHGPLHFLYRQTQIPFFEFFRRRLDIWITIPIALVSLTIFFFAGGALIWKCVSCEGALLIERAYILMAFFATWIVLQSLLGLLINEERVKVRCVSLNGVVNRRLETVRIEAERTVAEFKSDKTDKA